MNDKELEEKKKEYHDKMAAEMAHFVLNHFSSVKGYVPYGFHGHCKKALAEVINKLMDHEGEL